MMSSSTRCLEEYDDYGNEGFGMVCFEGLRGRDGNWNWTFGIGNCSFGMSGTILDKAGEDIIHLVQGRSFKTRCFLLFSKS